jgi:two-component system NtrC family sensor kinase
MMKPNSRLLIIDDNRAIHDDFRKILCEDDSLSRKFEETAAALFGEAPRPPSNGAASFQLSSAYQGKDGLGLVQKAVQQGQPFAMAFVDVRMPPGWDGVETTARIWEVDPDLQVVICTAYSDYSWSEMLEKLGRSDRLLILKKPFDNVEVLQLANSLARKWELLQESKGKVAWLEEMVAARTAQIVHEQEKFKDIFESSPDGIFQTTAEGRYLAANPALAGICGYATPKEMMEQVTDVQNQLYADPQQRAEFVRRLEVERVVRGFELEVKCKNGSRKWVSVTACKVVNPDGTMLYYQGFVVDITAQKSAQKERDWMEAQLRQAQKLESVGQLAAGIAHEINTPIQYIGDNIRFVDESFAGLSRLLQSCQKLAAAVPANAVRPEALAELASASELADIDYLLKEVPLAVQQSREGIGRVAKIVQAMKEFSHPGAKERTAVDLARAIDTTVTVATSEWKYVADMVTDFDPQLPPVPCLPGELNQVILNLIVNAAHAIGDVVKQKEGAKGVIKISTRADGPWAEIKIADTGAGIPESIRHRIFDPFFTTKEVGKGTGQGLAIAWSTVVDKHHGQLTFESIVGQGTTFSIRLPLRAEAAQPS